MDEQKKIASSTYYDLRDRLYRLNSLQIWAACAKARALDAEMPSMEAIFGSTSRVHRTWKHRRTGELVVSPECPGGDKMWECVKNVELITRQRAAKLTSSVELIYLAIDPILKEHLSKADRRELLRLLPVTGVYHGVPMTEREQQEFFETGSKEPETFALLEEMIAWLDGPGNCKAIKNARRVLNSYAVMAPRDGETVTYTYDRKGQSAFAT